MPGAPKSLDTAHLRSSDLSCVVDTSSDVDTDKASRTRWDGDADIDWVPEHKWGPHPDWVDLCWVNGKRVPLLPEGYVGKGYVVRPQPPPQQVNA